MKLKKVASLCGKSKRAYLFDRRNGGGEIIGQWIGDGCAVYPLDGLPYMEVENLPSLFDIPEKSLDKWIFRHNDAPDAVNFEDVDPEEYLLEDAKIAVIYDGTVLKPLETRRGIVFIQSAYLAPLDDVWPVMQLYERVTPSGQQYIAAKAGLLIAAVIFPYDAVNETFVECMEDLTRQCKMALDRKRFSARREELDPEQNTLFNVDDSTGEVVEAEGDDAERRRGNEV